jgi:phosphate transport system protein
MAEPKKHISSRFDQALYEPRNDVLMMSSLTDRMFHNAMSALLKRDIDLCEQVNADDEEVDVLEKQIDEEGVRLLIRFHPVATDMREVVSAMKISGHLERIGDHATAIAEDSFWRDAGDDIRHTYPPKKRESDDTSRGEPNRPG